MFAWKKDKYPNEHLNQHGRRFVARQLWREWWDEEEGRL
jgi:hypothetical protein